MPHGTFHPAPGLHLSLHHHGGSLQMRPASSTVHHHCRLSQVKPATPLKFCVQSSTAFVPAINPDDPQPPLQPLSVPLPPSNNGSPARPTKLNPSCKGPFIPSRGGQEWRVYANNNSNNGRWRKDDESALNKDEPLFLPMAYPGSTPNSKDMEDMKNCDPEKQECKDVLYQWTGKCSRCQGTGEVSFFRKKGREVICKCIPCMGLGYVHKITRRTNVESTEELDGAS